MKKLIVFVLFSGGLLFIGTARNQYDPPTQAGIEFIGGSWDEMRIRAREENKMIFLDIYASWCGPCKMLKRNTFSNTQVGEYFNTHFINDTLDGETGGGRLLARQYHVRAYPTMLFIMPDGSVKKSAVGYHTPKQLLRQAQSVLN